MWTDQPHATFDVRDRLPSCMGGWCRIRELCPCYAAATPLERPIERVCAPNMDGYARRIPWQLAVEPKA